MVTWILILWVSGHQLAIHGYTHEDCIDAAQVAREGRKLILAAYCIPGPKL